jgi:hypothetical protein
MILIALILPGLTIAYAFWVRPMLRALPQFKAFYAEADGFWARVWALCGKSATFAFAGFVQLVGWSLQSIDPLAKALGDPDMQAQITAHLQANPKVLGYVMIAISIITVMARLRTYAKDI